VSSKKLGLRLEAWWIGMLKKRPLLWSVLAISLAIGLAFSLLSVQAEPLENLAASPEVTHIFFSAGCADCWPYVEEVLLPTLQRHGLASRPEIHDYTVPSERNLLLEVADGVDLPRSIADSLYAFVPTQRGTLVVLGHVPPDLITEALTSPETPPRLVIWQPQMHGAPTEYRLWAWSGKVQTFPINTPFSKALSDTLNASGPLPVGLANLSELLPAVLVTGLLDSVNPCAFAVILLLLAFLFTLRQSRGRIL
jgi:hypothetical protein